MKFTKMQGIGNDYVYVNGFEEHIEDPSALAAAVSDRHFGIGGDALVVRVIHAAGAEIRLEQLHLRRQVVVEVAKEIEVILG